MYKNLTIASFLGLLAVILGAFGAHALKNILSESAMQSFQTAVRYQLFHVLVLLVLNLNSEISSALKKKISYFFIVGIVLFSGSIYTIYLLNVPAKFIWFVTPLGGLILIIGWAMLCYEFFKKVK